MAPQARTRWACSRGAKRAMLPATATPGAPWWLVRAGVKRRARLNVINHLLGRIPYEDLTPEAPDLPPRPPVEDDYVRPPKQSQNIVPEVVP